MVSVFRIFSVTYDSLSEVSKMVMDASTESSFWQIDSVKLTM